MSDPKPTKKQLQEQRREQARLARETEKKREKRNKRFLQGGVAVGVLAVIGIVALVLTQSMKPAGPGPENMQSGAVTIGQDLKVEATPALLDGESRVARTVDWESAPLDVAIYVDYMCIHCGGFEQQYGTMLENYIGTGDITLSVYPVNFLDTQSLGAKYSTRAANLLACVAEEQPDFTFGVHNLLLSAGVQPEGGTTGLTDDQLIEVAGQAGADMNTELKQCVKDVRFGSFISGNYKAASETGLLGLAPGAQLVDSATGGLQPADGPQRLQSTPTVIVNGEQWVDTRDGELESFLLKHLAELPGNAESGSEDE